MWLTNQRTELQNQVRWLCQALAWAFSLVRSLTWSQLQTSSPILFKSKVKCLLFHLFNSQAASSPSQSPAKLRVLPLLPTSTQLSLSCCSIRKTTESTCLNSHARHPSVAMVWHISPWLQTHFLLTYIPQILQLCHNLTRILFHQLITVSWSMLRLGLFRLYHYF